MADTPKRHLGANGRDSIQRNECDDSNSYGARRRRRDILHRVGKLQWRWTRLLILQARGTKIRIRLRRAQALSPSPNLSLQGSSQRRGPVGRHQIQQVTYAAGKRPWAQCCIRSVFRHRPSTTTPFLSNLRLNICIRTATERHLPDNSASSTNQAIGRPAPVGEPLRRPGMTGAIDITQAHWLFLATSTR